MSEATLKEFELLAVRLEAGSDDSWVKEEVDPKRLAAKRSLRGS